jgi:hypothetical protein
MQLKKDIWRCAIVPASADQILASGSLEGWPLTWIPGSGNLRYHADPFGLWRGDRLFVFTEYFDYRDAIGRIAATVYDKNFVLVEQGVVLREPWHLSYPFVFEAQGEAWLLPEAFQSGGLSLYRAVAFPHRWERMHPIVLDQVPLDATPFHDGERWWLFYAPAHPSEARLTNLCAAYADRLEGPWISYSDNPLLVDRHGARPGGTPVWYDGVLYLPLQDCRGTYGAALRLLRFDRLSPNGIVAVHSGMLHAPRAANPFVEGCHTLSAAGPVTLIDVKQTRFSPRGLTMRPLRDLRRAWREVEQRMW